MTLHPTEPPATYVTCKKTQRSLPVSNSRHYHLIVDRPRLNQTTYIHTYTRQRMAQRSPVPRPPSQKVNRRFLLLSCYSKANPSMQSNICIKTPSTSSPFCTSRTLRSRFSPSSRRRVRYLWLVRALAVIGMEDRS